MKNGVRGVKNISLFTFAIVLGCTLALCAGASLPALGQPLSTTSLQKIIEGAKKEGTVNVMLKSSFRPSSMGRLAKEIKKKYGVDLHIKYTPSANFPKMVAAAIMEHRAGAPSSQDLMTLELATIKSAQQAGILQRVDWKPLLAKGTPLDVMLGGPSEEGIKNLYGYALVYYTGHYGVMYNPRQVPEDQVPKTLRDLADPKWKGDVGIPMYPNIFVTDTYVRGKEKSMSDIEAILKNKAVLGRFNNLANLLTTGEIAMAYTASIDLKLDREKGVPMKFRCVDYSRITYFYTVVLKGARHPNAAKLVAIFLASPEGAKFTLRESGAGNQFYPGNFESNIEAESARLGLKPVIPEYDTKLGEFVTSKKAEKIAKEFARMYERR